MSNQSKFEGHTKYSVAFQLNNRFHFSMASRMLKKYGEQIWENDMEPLHNPKAPMASFLCSGLNKWLSLHQPDGLTVFQPADLEPFLQYLGREPKVSPAVVEEIDRLDREANIDYVTSNRIGPDEPMYGRSDED